MIDGQGEDDGVALGDQPAADGGVGAEGQHEAEARDDRRDGKRQVDQGDQQGLAAKVVFGDEPCGGDAEDGVQRHGDGGDDQGQLDRRCSLGVGEGFDGLERAFREGLGEDGDEGGEQQERQEDDDNGDQARSGTAGFRW